MSRHTAARTLHDLGLAAWFGGSMMGAVGLNGAAASLHDPRDRATAATVGWTRWAPVSAVAIGAHLLGGAQLLRTEQTRVRHQRGVALSSGVKTGLTAAALATTAWTGVLNRRMAAAVPVPVEGATEPAPDTPPDVAATQRQLRPLQWAIPALTAGLVGVTAWQGEQMRPKEVAAGTLAGVYGRVAPARLPLAGAVAAGVALVVARRRRARAARSTTYLSSDEPGVYPESTHAARPAAAPTHSTDAR